MAQIKTAVSLDKSLYEQIDTLAHKMKGVAKPTVCHGIGGFPPAS